MENNKKGLFSGIKKSKAPIDLSNFSPAALTEIYAKEKELTSSPKLRQKKTDTTRPRSQLPSNQIKIRPRLEAVLHGSAWGTEGGTKVVRDFDLKKYLSAPQEPSDEEQEPLADVSLYELNRELEEVTPSSNVQKQNSINQQKQKNMRRHIIGETIKTADDIAREADLERIKKGDLEGVSSKYFVKVEGGYFDLLRYKKTEKNKSSLSLAVIKNNIPVMPEYVLKKYTVCPPKSEQAEQSVVANEPEPQKPEQVTEAEVPADASSGPILPLNPEKLTMKDLKRKLRKEYRRQLLDLGISHQKFGYIIFPCSEDPWRKTDSRLQTMKMLRLQFIKRLQSMRSLDSLAMASIDKEIFQPLNNGKYLDMVKVISFYRDMDSYANAKDVPLADLSDFIFSLEEIASQTDKPEAAPEQAEVITDQVAEEVSDQPSNQQPEPEPVVEQEIANTETIRSESEQVEYEPIPEIKRFTLLECVICPEDQTELFKIISRAQLPISLTAEEAPGGAKIKAVMQITSLRDFNLIFEIYSRANGEKLLTIQEK